VNYCFGNFGDRKTFNLIVLTLFRNQPHFYFRSILLNYLENESCVRVMLETKIISAKFEDDTTLRKYEVLLIMRYFDI